MLHVASHSSALLEEAPIANFLWASSGACIHGAKPGKISGKKFPRKSEAIGCLRRLSGGAISLGYLPPYG